MEIRTERLLLREMRDGDFDAMYGVLADSDIMRHYPYTFDERRVRNWISRNIERYAVFGFGLWAVERLREGDVIGDCGITMQNIHGVIRPEIGYHIRGSCQRRGFAREAASACRDWAFEHTTFGVLYSYMKSDNVASRATAVSCKMKHVEDYCDDNNELTSVYAITREEWSADVNKNTDLPEGDTSKWKK